MATSSTVAFAKSKLVEMSLHSHATWKNRTEADKDYFRFLVEASGRNHPIDIPSKLEATYTRCHG